MRALKKANKYHKTDNQYNQYKVIEEDNSDYQSPVKVFDKANKDVNKVHFPVQSFSKFNKSESKPGQVQAQAQGHSNNQANMTETAKFAKTGNDSFDKIPLEDDKFSPLSEEYNNIYMNSYQKSKAAKQLTTVNNTLNPNIIYSKDHIESEENENEEDEEVELQAESKQIMNYQRSLSSKYKFNLPSQMNQNNKAKAKQQPNSTFNLLMNNENNEDDENDLVVELSKLRKENLQLRQKIVDFENSKDKEINDQLEDLKLKLSQKTKEFKEANHKLTVTEEINSELEQSIMEIKTQLIEAQKLIKEKDELISKRSQEDDNQDKFESIKSKLEKSTSELEKCKDDLITKTNKINELQSRVLQLEKERIEINSKSTSESISLKELKGNYESLKLENIEYKNNNDLLNLKLNTVMEENSSLKKEIFFLEREIGNKTALLNKSKISVNPQYENGIRDNSKVISKDSQAIGGFNKFSKRAETAKYRQTDEDANNYASNMKRNMRSQIFSSEKDKKPTQIQRRDPNESYNNKDTNLISFNNRLEENRINQIETRISQLNKERLDLNCELNKFPQNPKTREKIMKKNQLEEEIVDVTKEINKLKIELRNINNEIKDQ